jgi:hypothetical protein
VHKEMQSIVEGLRFLLERPLAFPEEIIIIEKREKQVREKNESGGKGKNEKLMGKPSSTDSDSPELKAAVDAAKTGGESKTAESSKTGEHAKTEETNTVTEMVEVPVTRLHPTDETNTVTEMVEVPVTRLHPTDFSRENILIVNIGSGCSILHVTESSFERVGGTAVGGGILEGT